MADPTPLRSASRVYLRVSTEEQDLARQEAIVEGARATGYHVAAIYREKASGARPDRPELLRMIKDLQPGEVVVAEKIDRISRLPLPEAELLVATIRGTGARLAVPGIVDLSELVADSAGVTRIVLEAVQDMLLRVALQTARDDYETRRERQREGIEIAKRAGRYTGRRADAAQHRRIVGLREAGLSIARTAELAGCSLAQVKRVTKLHRAKATPAAPEGVQAEERKGASAKPRARLGIRTQTKQGPGNLLGHPLWACAPAKS